MQTVSTINLEAFKRTVIFSVSIRRWGNRAQVKDAAALEAYLEERNRPDGETALPSAVEGAAKSGGKTGSVKATKALIQSEAYATLCTYLNETKNKCLTFAMPSFVREGMFIVKESNIRAVQEILAAAERRLEDELVPAFVLEYNSKIDDARTLPVKKGGLGPIFNARDYPAPELIGETFGLKWNWLALTVPENLPEEIRAQEIEKGKQAVQDMFTEMRSALRSMFAEILSHMTERLTVEPGSKAKVFRNSLVENMQEFFDTFDAKDITSDAELAGLVAQCRAVMGTGTPDALTADKLRTDSTARDATLKALATIKEQADKMVEEQGGRAFDFADDQAAAA